MNPPRPEKLLQDIDRLLDEAPDEAARAELRALRERLNSPEVRDLARELASRKPKERGDLVLEFHDPLVPGVLTATGCVIAAAVCVFAISEGFDNPILKVGSTQLNLWIVAAFSGALSTTLTALSFARSFSVRFDTGGMTSRFNGARWRGLRVGAMNWSDIRALHERDEDGVLEIRAAGGTVLDIPMRILNYPILHQHLENMVMLYGERA
jgi:hypothetical protein